MSTLAFSILAELGSESRALCRSRCITGQLKTEKVTLVAVPRSIYWWEYESTIEDSAQDAVHDMQSPCFLLVDSFERP
jgi:hypothetical protein